MQWLIDLITEILEERIGFVDRGDPGSFDWDKTDLTTDWTWRDLDCSAIVPENAAAILFYIQIMDDALTRDFQIRKKGNVNVVNRSNLKCQVANIVVSGDFVCPCDANRFVQYRATNAVFSNILIAVKGWWLR